MPVSETSKATTDRRLASGPDGRAPAAQRRRDLETHAALLGELEGVRQQVLQNLLQALGIGHDAAVEVRIELDVERRAAGFPLRAGTAARPSRARLVKKISSASTVTVPDSIFDRSRMSLMRLSRSVPAPWMVRANSTCLRVQIAVRVLARAAGRESGCCSAACAARATCWRGIRTCTSRSAPARSPFPQRAARLLDFLVLALHLDVALGELLRLLLELLVGLLQLLLLRLQFAGELLRLLQQALRSASSPRCCSARCRCCAVSCSRKVSLQRREAARARQAR